MRAQGCREDLASRLRPVFERHPEIEAVWLFGSQAEGRSRPDSDLDVAVAADAPLDTAQKRALIEQLAEATGRPVDLVDLHTAGEPLLGRLLQGKPLLVRDRKLFVELVKRHLIDVEDFLPLQRRLL
ncbi:MAG: nucleotidyltransferase domain-containing protein, partial [Gammaproteobacteria bacterium]